MLKNLIVALGCVSLYVRLFATPCTVACQAPLFLGFSRQEYWSGLPFPSPGDLSHPGIKASLLCRQILYHLSHFLGSPLLNTDQHHLTMLFLDEAPEMLEWFLLQWGSPSPRNGVSPFHSGFRCLLKHFMCLKMSAPDSSVPTVPTPLGGLTVKPSGPCANVKSLSFAPQFPSFSIQAARGFQS